MRGEWREGRREMSTVVVLVYVRVEGGWQMGTTCNIHSPRMRGLGGSVPFRSGRLFHRGRLTLFHLGLVCSLPACGTDERENGVYTLRWPGPASYTRSKSDV